MDASRGLIAGDDTVPDGDDAVSEFGDVGLVGDEDDGVAAGMKIVEERHDLVAGLGVEVSGRLVRQDDGGIVDQGASDGDALALAAGEFVGFVQHARAEADALEGSLGALLALCCRSAVIDERQLDVVERCGPGQEIEGLEDESDLLVSDTGQLVVVQLGDVVAIEPVFALGWGVETADEIHQGRFSGAGRTHDSDIFVVTDTEIDAAKGVDLLVTHLIGLPEMIGNDNLSGMGAGGIADGSVDCGFDSHPILRLLLQPRGGAGNQF